MKDTKEQKEYKKPTKPGTYIGLHLSSESEKELHKLQTKLNIKEKFPFHITLVYSRKKLKMDLNKKINKIIFADKFHIFDNTKDGGDRALVIFFKCPYCEQRHNYAKTMGATWDYPSYDAHITLAYNWSGPKPDNELLEKFKINIVSEYEEILNLEWSDTNVKIEESEKIPNKGLKNLIDNNPALKVKFNY